MLVTFASIVLASFGAVLLIWAAEAINLWRAGCRGGVAQNDELIKVDARFSRLLDGNIPPANNGTLITMRKGIGIEVSENGIYSVEPTCTISRDIV